MAWQEIIPNSRIDPPVRPPKEPIGFASARDAFDSGNYPVALDMARGSDPAHYALSMIMGGNIHRGVALLEGLPDLPEGAKNVQAYAHWCLGQNTEFAAGFQRQAGCPIDILMITMPGSAKAFSFDNVAGFNVRHLQLMPDDFGSTVRAILDAKGSDFSPALAVVIDCFALTCPVICLSVGFRSRSGSETMIIFFRIGMTISRARISWSLTARQSIRS